MFPAKFDLGDVLTRALKARLVPTAQVPLGVVRRDPLIASRADRYFTASGVHPDVFNTFVGAAAELSGNCGTRA
jgi:hypothetical protein